MNIRPREMHDDYVPTRVHSPQNDWTNIWAFVCLASIGLMLALILHPMIPPPSKPVPKHCWVQAYEGNRFEFCRTINQSPSLKGATR